jgi:amino acid transporter
MANRLLRKKSLSTILEDRRAGFTDTDTKETGSLKRVLTVRDLTSMGIAAVVGAGIFSTIGTAAYNGGPGISILFIITAITCGFSALCYAEFASRVPVAGSAYTYAYVAFGELIAWVIGWALILEYAIANIVVAISWSGYFNNLLIGLGIHLPGWLTMDFTTASIRYKEATAALSSGKALNITLQYAQDAWNNAPLIAGYKIFLNIPAVLIVIAVTWLAYIGIKETRNTTNLMVALKIGVILFVIFIGFFYVEPENWNPFLPNGFSGVLRGVSAVFYAYIGFDAISTTAEECKNPRRDLPRAMVYSLLICTILYILIALVLTGMVSYTELRVDDPLAFVFNRINKPWIAYIISISAVIATTSVLLIFQLGQPRIWMSMSRDGLLPKKFSRIHPKFGTPSYGTIATGILVAVPTLFLDAEFVTDLTSIGTLFAFVVVCAGVLYLPPIDKELENPQNSKRFKLPYINAKIIIPVLAIFLTIFFWEHIEENIKFSEGWEVWRHHIPFYLFIIMFLIMAFLSFKNNYSLIPVLGVLSCFFLMTEIGVKNWFVFGLWLIIGLIFYFNYGYKRSRLNK